MGFKNIKKRVDVPTLMYHEVTDKKNFKELSRVTQYSYIVSDETFEKQMKYLYEMGYTSLSINELFQIIYNNRDMNDEKYILITFDDGFIGNYEYVFPILNKYNLKGNIFLITNNIGKKYMLNWKQINEMIKHSFTFGSHTANHEMIAKLNDKKINSELEISKNEIENKTGQIVKYLSLPHGSYRKDYKNIAANLGYHGGFTSNPGVNSYNSEPFYLNRMTVPRSAKLQHFKNICEIDSKVYFKVILKKRIIKAIKNIVGEERYLTLYNKIFGVSQYK